MVTDLAAVALGGGDAGLAQAGHAVTFPLPLHVSGAAVTRALSRHVGSELLLQRDVLSTYMHTRASAQSSLL